MTVFELICLLNRMDSNAIVTVRDGDSRCEFDTVDDYGDEVIIG